MIVPYIIYRNIATRRQQWQNVARFYNQAQTPAVRRVVMREFQKNGKASGMMRDNVRSVEFKKLPREISFGYGRMTFDREGKNFAQQLATYLKRQNVAEVTLIGHTAPKGSHAINDRISKKRSLS